MYEDLTIAELKQKIADLEDQGFVRAADEAKKELEFRIFWGS